MTRDDLTAQLLPLLGRSLDVGFNVFDVMHHGTHEKQLSNVFRWLLEIGGTHNFDELGQHLFVEYINQGRESDAALPLTTYSVRQEVNTAEVEDGDDIADIVLESDSAVIILENYGTSDGHGHGYDRYLRFGQRDGKTAAVVMLCAEEDRSRLADGWEQAVVVTYERFLDLLVMELNRDTRYGTQNPEQYAFISQLHRKFASGKERMSSKYLLDFVTAMCATGEAGRYQENSRDKAANRFAEALAQQAREQFIEGAEVLQIVKARLRTYGETVLRKQVNESMGKEFIDKVTAGYKGIYQWTIDFEISQKHGSSSETHIQFKFGPSAWFANEQGTRWKQKVDPETADYSRLFLTRARNHELRQSSVTLHEVLDGLSPTDTRLRDEIIDLLQGS